MFRPILPRPTNPISMSAPLDVSVGRLQAGPTGRLKPRPYRRSEIAVNSSVNVSLRIRGSRAGRCTCSARRSVAPSDAKSPSACASSSVPNENGSPGMSRSSSARRRDQHEHAGVRPTLVQLPGRVQIARTVARHRRRACRCRGPTCENGAALVEASDLVRGRRGPPGSRRPQERSGSTPDLCRRSACRAALLSVSVTPSCSRRVVRGGRQVSVGLVAVEQHARRVLGLLHVRFVERVDAEERAGDGRRDFPPHEFGAERRRLRKLDRRDRRVDAGRSSHGRAILRRGCVGDVAAGRTADRRP